MQAYRMLLEAGADPGHKDADGVAAEAPAMWQKTL
jgi:hypothetical protein